MDLLISTPRTLEHSILERARLFSVMDAAAAATAIVSGPEHVYDFANHAYQRIFLQGRSYEGKPIREVFPELLNSGIFEKLDQVYETGIGIDQSEIPVEIRGADGVLRLGYYSYSIAPYLNEAECVEGLILTGVNVTESVQARVAFQNRHLWLEEVVNRLPAFVSYIDPEGRYLFVNQAYLDWFGVKADAIVGKKRHEFTTAETARLAEPHERRALAGQVVRYENTLIKPNGESVNVEVEFRPDFDPASGKVRGAVIIGHDITERKATQQALEAAVKARDEFVSVASHELKTPLTSMRLHAQMTKRNILRGRPGALDSEQILKLTELVDNSTQKLTRLVDDMLDISRISTGKLSIVRERFEIVTLVKEVIERLQVQALSTGASIAWEAKTPIEGFWDRFRIEQVITNLLTNAIRYGEGTPIEVRLEKHDDRMRLSVKDQGPGIPLEIQEKIFQRYERGPGVDLISGLGLGLFICREIVNHLGGRLWVESSVGEGALFIVELPLALDEDVGEI